MSKVSVGTNHSGGDATSSSKIDGDVFNSGATLDLSSLSNVSYTGHQITEIHGIQGDELQGSLAIMANGMAKTAGTAATAFTTTLLNSNVAKIIAVCAIVLVGFKVFGKKGRSK